MRDIAGGSCACRRSCRRQESLECLEEPSVPGGDRYLKDEPEPGLTIARDAAAAANREAAFAGNESTEGEPDSSPKCKRVVDLAAQLLNFGFDPGAEN